MIREREKENPFSALQSINSIKITLTLDVLNEQNGSGGDVFNENSPRIRNPLCIALQDER